MCNVKEQKEKSCLERISHCYDVKCTSFDIIPASVAKVIS